mmetsp:Transcript_43107/g.77456  ORF Transcript_43107/g.77456 Transcript_43107/m.77456 type:complete len:95 (-) Transcript_43107:302-586(-)
MRVLTPCVRHSKKPHVGSCMWLSSVDPHSPKCVWVQHNATLNGIQHIYFVRPLSVDHLGSDQLLVCFTSGTKGVLGDRGEGASLKAMPVVRACI